MAYSAETGVLAYGSAHSVDFGEKTFTLRLHGNMPSIRAGSYVIVDTIAFDNLLRMANLWKAENANSSTPSEHLPDRTVG